MAGFDGDGRLKGLLAAGVPLQRLLRAHQVAEL
jgi:hypothetical protein